jgi:methylmalonyl-CoA epimerase
MSTGFTIRRIAVAVRNLDQARRVYETLLGAELAPPENGTTSEVRSLEWRRGAGEPVLELVQPLDEDSALARFIRKQGEGVHHVSVTVPDLEAALARIEPEGRVVRTASYYLGPDGGPLTEAFLHPKDAHGVLFHLAEEA